MSDDQLNKNSSSDAASAVDAPGYKLTMANILSGARHHTRYVKALEKITVDASISYERIVFGLGVGVAVLVIFALMMTKGPGDFTHTKVWFIPFFVSLLILVILYVLPSRNRSLLRSTFDLLRFQLYERSRRKLLRNSSITSVGIKKCDEDGLIHFDNGDVGYLYNVEGQVSRSILPAVAKAQIQLRHQYLIQRPATLQEKLMTSVKQVDVRSKKRYLRDLYLKTKDSDAPEKEWILHYTSMLHGVIVNNIESDETQLFQALMLRDESELTLEKSVRIFEDAASQGMYARAQRITNDADIARYLHSITMLSRESLEDITGEDESLTVVGEFDASNNSHANNADVGDDADVLDSDEREAQAEEQAKQTTSGKGD